MDNYQNPKPGKTYISPSLTAFGDKSQSVRIASKVLPSADGYEYVKERGEIVVRRKPDAATYISAKFLEDTRKVFVLTVQKFNTESGTPYGSGFSFVGEEINRFCEFLYNIKSVTFENKRTINVTDEELRRIALTNKQAKDLVYENEEIFSEVLKHSLTKQDVVAVAYRKKQLEIFRKLLEDNDYFSKIKAKKSVKDEALWQQFFEKNQWIFGYGLSFIYSASFDRNKLEQVVQGHQIQQHGKRVDALLKTKALISSLCFVEIKTHLTDLLASTSYRSGCWAPSSELVGAVAQIQGTVSYASESIKGKLTITDSEGYPTGEEAFNYQPRAFIVVGNLGQFMGDHGVSHEKLRSFELYRRNTAQPEIITFDELYERAKHIVLANES